MRRSRSIWPSSNGTRPKLLVNSPGAGGRPPIYDPETFPEIAYEYCSKLGFTNKQLAALFMVTENCIESWLREHQQFFRRVRDGRWDFDSGAVTKALVTRACGYDLVERFFEWKTNEETGERERVLVRETNKHIPPDPTSIIFWLTNRQKEYWRREVRHEHTGKDGQPIQSEDPATHALLRELLKKASPDMLVGLRSTLENIACANTDPC